VKDWNAGKIKVLLAHPASAGYGLNLQAGGSTIVWYGMPWSLELYQQANARLHRQGQKRTVVIHHLVTADTMDESVLAALQKKRKGQDAMLEAVKAKLEEYKHV
jgi:SNF2 family DNA or RNA helicase